MASSIVLFKVGIQFTDIEEKREQNIFTFKKLELEPPKSSIIWAIMRTNRLQ